MLCKEDPNSVAAANAFIDAPLPHHCSSPEHEVVSSIEFRVHAGNLRLVAPLPTIHMYFLWPTAVNSNCRTPGSPGKQGLYHTTDSSCVLQHTLSPSSMLGLENGEASENDNYSISDDSRCGDYSFNNAEGIADRYSRRTADHLVSWNGSSSPSNNTIMSFDTTKAPFNSTPSSKLCGHLKVDGSTLDYIFSFETDDENDFLSTDMLHYASVPMIEEQRIYPFGMILPIDDNEYAILKAYEMNQDIISYEIFSPEAITPPPPPTTATHTTTSSPSPRSNFCADEELSSLCLTEPPEGSSANDIYSSNNSTKISKSPSLSRYISEKENDPLSHNTASLHTADSFTSSSTSNHESLVASGSESCPASASFNHNDSFSAVFHTTNHSPTLSTDSFELASNPTEACSKPPDSSQASTSKDTSKTTLSLFENNGLFMKRDHPIFAQIYSRKVFVGGLPRDVTIDEIEKQFCVFGALHVDWPNREEELIPPNGFAFLHYEAVSSVHKLHNSVSKSKSKNKYVISSHSVKIKEVEVKFWRMSDAEVLCMERTFINPRYTVFVGALPRIATAQELASFMEKSFSSVVYAAIDVDLIYGYPKGAGRVTFGTKTSYKKALDSHYIDMDIGFGSRRKRIEIKPFLLPDQKCDLCVNSHTSQCANKYCYRCGYFICDQCETNEACIGQHPHNIIGRSSDQLLVSQDMN